MLEPAAIQALLPDTAGRRPGVAFSGGLDSLVLLHLVKTLSPLAPVALHVNHNARDPHSVAQECSFVEDACHKMDIELRRRHLEPGGRTDENSLRTRRYEALASMAGELDLAWVALGHHAGDQLETFLLRLLRGSDLRGLCGMPAAFARHGTSFVRPLLATARDDISAYAKSHGLAHFTDPSNDDPRYARNLVRQRLLPLVETVAPGFPGRLPGLLASLADLKSLRDHAMAGVQSRIPWIAAREPGEWSAARPALRELPRALLCQWCHDSLVRFGAGEGRITRRHVERLADFITSGATGYCSEPFPGDLQVRARKGLVLLRHIPRKALAKGPESDPVHREKGSKDA